MKLELCDTCGEPASTEPYLCGEINSGLEICRECRPVVSTKLMGFFESLRHSVTYESSNQKDV